MRIEKLEISAYGCFVDRNIPNLPTGLVLIHGLNEAGKSTLFNLLTTLLYGFHPVTGFPYRPWHVDRYPELHASLTLQDGSQIEVWRKLASAPQGRFTRGNRTQELANRALPFTQHVSEDLYKALYAVTQTNMHSLKEADRKQIEDRLLSGLGAELLKPTHQVIADLEKRAQKLWRRDRRGTPKYRDLQRQLRDAKNERKEAEEKDRSLRDKADRLREVQVLVKKLEQELVELNRQLRKADVLGPVKQRIEQIKAWRSEIPDIARLRSLPDGLEAEYKRLCDRVDAERKAVEALQAERRTKSDVKNRFSEEDRAVLVYTERINRWARRVTAHEQEERNIRNLEGEAADIQQSLESIADSTLAVPWDDAFSVALDKIALSELKARIIDFQNRQKEAERRKTAVESIAPARMTGGLPGWFTWVAAGTVALGLLLILLGLTISPAARVPGLILSLLGASTVAFSLFSRRQNAQLEAQHEDEIERLRKSWQESDYERDEACRAVRTTLEGLPVASALLEYPDLTLYQAVERLRSLNSSKKQKAKHFRLQRETWNTAQKEMQDLVEALGEPTADPEALDRLEDRLKTAKNHQRDFNHASTRIEEINEELEGAEKALEDATGEHKKFLRHVAQAAAEDLPPDDALKRAAELQETLRKMRSVEDQLEMDHPDLAELKEEIERLEEDGEGALVLDQEAVERFRLRRDELQDKDGALQRLRDERITLQTEIDNARSDVSVSELDGKIATIEEEMEDVCIQHDRLALLSSVLREADRRFREEHQPDVLRRAGEHLARITDGDYTRIITLDDRCAGERLAVVGKQGEYQPLESPLSSGTLDQIHLAFRLAVIDHLDEGHEHLPLVLDEVLINWDDQRFEAGAQILADIARKRQVFLFTCHGWAAERIYNATKTEPIELSKL